MCREKSVREREAAQWPTAAAGAIVAVQWTGNGQQWNNPLCGPNIPQVERSSRYVNATMVEQPLPRLTRPISLVSCSVGNKNLTGRLSRVSYLRGDRGHHIVATRPGEIKPPTVLFQLLQLSEVDSPIIDIHDRIALSCSISFVLGTRYLT